MSQRALHIHGWIDAAPSISERTRHDFLSRVMNSNLAQKIQDLARNEFKGLSNVDDSFCRRVSAVFRPWIEEADPGRDHHQGGLQLAPETKEQDARPSLPSPGRPPRYS
jgi:hypothetical protein